MHCVKLFGPCLANPVVGLLARQLKTPLMPLLSMEWAFPVTLDNRSEFENPHPQLNCLLSAGEVRRTLVLPPVPRVFIMQSTIQLDFVSWRFLRRSGAGVDHSWPREGMEGWEPRLLAGHVGARIGRSHRYGPSISLAANLLRLGLGINLYGDLTERALFQEAISSHFHAY